MMKCFRWVFHLKGDSMEFCAACKLPRIDRERISNLYREFSPIPQRCLKSQGIYQEIECGMDMIHMNVGAQ